MQGHLLSERRDGTLFLTLSNPAARNALGPALYDALANALTNAAEDDAVHCVILSGADGVFSAGGNLVRLLGNRSRPRSVQADSIEGLNRCTAAIRACPKPVIAAVEGFAAGSGLSIALACDFIIAATTAKFVMSYIKVALTPDGGGAWELVRSLPKAVVSDALLNGAALAAGQLAAYGVVNRTVSPGSTIAAATELAESLGQRSPHALALMKQLIEQAASQARTAYLEYEKTTFLDALYHRDGGEGITAFLEKRRASY
ncbi:enoyl-CoA hydratase family protein [Caballeronia sp. SEWSISQ10-4 2]|uniref:oxepin-CoA hydrolase, alternative type n=1 Tax=Caballeronia sp. SEWSISQ10-4 2 TaxID=2937438 RepID=UPI00264EFFA6|nr:enoyl-CoA hydratase family protein [Caballeronia sp. SEWSISQ10-4 2]MDN7179024.1 enoyl-CoA hydratase family protein [Caballeronia sp. SEWSISQ10-4 2]